MAGSLNGRVNRLENGRVVPCEECDFAGVWENFKVVWVNQGTLDPSEPKRCKTCGQELEITVTWDGTPDPPEAA